MSSESDLIPNAPLPVADHPQPARGRVRDVALGVFLGLWMFTISCGLLAAAFFAFTYWALGGDSP